MTVNSDDLDIGERGTEEQAEATLIPTNYGALSCSLSKLLTFV
jgi:hypothetical protein